MKKTTVYHRFLVILVFYPMILLFLGCPLMQPPLADENPIDYYSKIVEYSRYVDPNEYYLEPVETRIFNEEGVLDGIFRYYYEPFTPGSEYWILKKTEVYAVNDGGEAYLSEYYVYTYVEDTYTEYDEDDQPYSLTDYLLSKGEVYKSDDFRYNFYDVVYEDFLYEPDRYLSIIDQAYDADTGLYSESARQTSTYKIVFTTTIGTVTVDYYDYVTEKFFVIPPGETGLALSQEFASWYDTNGLWTHELYHTVRGTDTPEDVYYYTKYDWNESYQVYLQQDFLYDFSFASVPVLTAQAEAFLDNTYNEALMDAYILEFDAIGILEESATFSYDDLNNMILKIISYQGSEQERIRYRYNSDSEETSMARYVHGQSYPYDRVENRYRDEYREGEYYRVREEYTYKSYDSSNSRSSVFRSSATSRNPSQTVLTDFKAQAYRPIRSNHEHAY